MEFNGKSIISLSQSFVGASSRIKTESIESIAEKISKAINSGNSIEIHPAKDGVRIYEVKKKVIG